MADDETRRRLIHQRITKIRPLLAGLPSALQGAILAELTATWLAGHVVPGSEKGTRAAWEALLTVQAGAVRAFAELEYRERGGADYGIGPGEVRSPGDRRH